MFFQLKNMWGKDLKACRAQKSAVINVKQSNEKYI